MSTKQPPKIVTDAGLSMFVDVLKLRELALPIVEIELEKLLWHFDMPVWAKEGTEDWNLTPWQVIHKEEGSGMHQKRVFDADTQYPIVLTEYNGRLAALDGVHRMVKIYIQGGTKIAAKIIPAEYLSRPEFKT